MTRTELAALLHQAEQEHWAGEKREALLDTLMSFIEPVAPKAAPKFEPRHEHRKPK